MSHSSHAPRQPPLSHGQLDAILAEVRRRFYPPEQPGGEERFFRDRRMLLYALSWPAVWLRQRALTCSPARYRSLIHDRLGAIAAHGDPARYTAYFPAYLLKCLQDWFHHHGDELYDELKRLRNALDMVLASPGFAAQIQRHGEQLDVLAAAHQLVHPKRNPPGKSDSAQLSLF